MKEQKVEVPIGADQSHLSKRERSLLTTLAELAPLIDELYRKQVPKENENVYYPADLSKEAFEQYLKDNPAQAEALTSPYTIVRSSTDGSLFTIAYSVFFGEDIAKICALFNQAAELCDDPALKDFLLSRAEAFSSNEYEESERRWIELDSAAIELTIGPAEEYDDTFWAVKRSFEMILGVTLPEENEKLKQYMRWAADYDAALAQQYGYQAVPSLQRTVIVDQISAAGYATLAYVPQAYNLPNDNAIKQKYGSKLVFMRNIMDAKFAQMTRPIADRLLSAEDAARFDSADHVRAIIGHELAHGLGIRCKEGLREHGHVLEEAKADVFGITFLYWLGDRIPAGQAEAAAFSVTLDGIRQIRHNPDEAHAVGANIRYNWLLQCGAISISDGKIQIHRQDLRAAYETLSSAFASVALSNNYETAQQFVEEWGKPVEQLRPLLEKLDGIPTDILPVFEY